MLQRPLSFPATARRPRRLSQVAALFMLAWGAGCSDEPSATEASGGGGPGGGGAGGTAGAGGTDLPGYEEAVKAASWVKLEAAPSVTGGRKNDDIFFIDAMRGFLASGPSETIFATSDGGLSWQPAFEHEGTFFRALLFTNEQRGFAGNLGAGLVPSVDDPTVIYATDDGGATWSPVTDITGPAPSGICNFHAVDAEHIVGVGRANGPSHLLLSNDGGASFASRDLGAWLRMPIDARFVSATEGIVAGMGNDTRCTIVRTTDGGGTFEPVFTSQTLGSLCWKLDFPTAAVGFVAVQDTAGGPGTFGKTTDGGLTWEELPLPVIGGYAAIGVGFITENIGWMVSADPQAPVYRTHDGGMSWHEEPVLRGPINRFRFVDTNTAYAAGGDVYKLEVDYQAP